MIKTIRYYEFNYIIYIYYIKEEMAYNTYIKTSNNILYIIFIYKRSKAEDGIEPSLIDLQSSTLPLCYSAFLNFINHIIYSFII